jgi:hypothetical protein
MENNNSVQSDNVPGSTVKSTINEGTTEMIETTTVVEPQYPSKLQANINASYFANDVSTIIAYLNKPIPVTSGAWSTGSTAGTLLYNQDAWVGVWANTMWKEKLHGIFGLRATLRVDLVLNATPFHAGRLRLCYYPAAATNMLKYNMHIGHRIPLSQLPGLDIGCGDEAISLKIPYVTPQRFIELTGSIVSWGNVIIAIMSPLNTGTLSDSTADYTLWYSMEDVELFGQTNKAVSQQSTPGKSRPKRINASETELKPISHTLGAASEFVGNVAKIPFLTPWAGPVSWFLNAAKGAAIAFGFSTPINTELPCMMSTNFNWHTTTSDGTDNSIPLSLLYDAKLKILDDVTAGGEDQMSINFIKRQWSFFTTFTINESNTLGQSLFATYLQPDQYKIAVSATESYYTPIAYLARMYNMYRGGMEVMLKFVKTGFHAGSLAISFVPGPNDATLSLTDTSYVYRTVIDLQEGDQACFICPYLIPLDFIDSSIGFGRFYVNVVNPLRSPDTVASTVDVLVYVRAADSFQVQQPANWNNWPITQQGGDITEYSEEIVCSTVGQGPTATLDYEFCQESMSEAATSILQLAKRYNAIAFQFPSIGTGDVIIMHPWAIGIPRFITPNYTDTAGLYDPLLALVTCPFAFYRGGVRIRLNQSASTDERNVCYMKRVEATGGPAYQAVSFAANTAPYITDAYIPTLIWPLQPLPVATNAWNFGGLSVQIPYQAPYRFCPIQYFPIGNQNTNFYSPRPKLEIYHGLKYDRLATRAVSDDYQCLFWVGIPRLEK